jgi:16S rRNA (guanine1207-N2)-methyltransferase
VLWAFPPRADDVLAMAAMAGRSTAVCEHRGVWQALRHAGVDARWGVGRHPLDPPDTVLVPYPRARAQLDATLHWIAATLPAGTAVHIVGHNRSGIEGLAKRMSGWEDVEEVDRARHSVLVHARLPEGLAREAAATDPMPRHRRRVEAAGHTLDVVSLPGVFAAGDLDDGTAMLLGALEGLRGHVLDFACGAGVVGAWLARTGCRVTLCDVSALAVCAAEETLHANGLMGEVHASDGWQELPQGSWDHIVSNPPFHQGVEKNLEVGTALIREAPARLSPGGTLTVVGNRFLPWGRIMEEVFGRSRVVAEDGRYRVWTAVRTAAASGPPAAGSGSQASGSGASGRKGMPAPAGAGSAPAAAPLRRRRR